MRTSGRILGCFLLLGCWASGFALATVQLPAVLSDHMVLQSGVRVPIWGTADPHEPIVVSLADQRAETVADAQGRWRVRIGPLGPGGPYEMTIQGSETITIQDILVGEVWLCSGQSNMQWPVKRALNAEQEIAQANYPQIRLFTVRTKVADKPADDVDGKWVLCSPETVGNFSAVGYFFGRYLHQAREVPVGLIHSSWGGTPAEAWTSLPTLESDPTFRPLLRRWQQRLENYPRAQREYRKKLAEWEQAVAKAKVEGSPLPPKPRPPIGPDHSHRPGVLYNGMIAPLIPYAIKGVIWYQGESNASRAYEYRKLFPLMIDDWRRAWGQGEFPFLFVQLANFAAWGDSESGSAWAELREAQTMALAWPNTGMVVAIDIGESHDIHPKNKQEVGRRLALAARALAYGEDLVYSGPLYKDMRVEGNRIRITFDHVGSGLTTPDNQPLKGFTVAGTDGRFVWAKAQIDGDSVLVWNPSVRHPVAVRYGWASDPTCNLYNKEGLPASPFRTDRWPGVTADQPDVPKRIETVKHVDQTYRLPEATVEAVEAAWLQLLRQSAEEDIGPLSPSRIVQRALEIALEGLQNKGTESELFRRLQAE